MQYHDQLVQRAHRTARIDKSSRFTDWSRTARWSQRQIDYALADVTHLRPIYKKLKRKLRHNGREAWLGQEMDILTDPATYRLAPEDAWRRLKPRSPDRRFLAVLRSVAAWREQEAQRRDVPRNRVLRDEQLMDIAAHRPKSAEHLGRTRGLSLDFAQGRLGQGILPSHGPPRSGSVARARAQGHHAAPMSGFVTAPPVAPSNFLGIITVAPQMKSLFEVLKRVAKSDATVLLRGETGTGKELFARALHTLGPRSEKPFQAVNCATLRGDLLASELFGHVRGAFTGAIRDHKGLFESAHGGTCFSTRSPSCPSTCRPASCACCKSAALPRWARPTW